MRGPPRGFPPRTEQRICGVHRMLSTSPLMPASICDTPSERFASNSRKSKVFMFAAEICKAFYSESEGSSTRVHFPPRVAARISAVHSMLPESPLMAATIVETSDELIAPIFFKSTKRGISVFPLCDIRLLRLALHRIDAIAAPRLSAANRAAHLRGPQHAVSVASDAAPELVDLDALGSHQFA